MDLGPLYDERGRPLYACPIDWDHFVENRPAMHQVAEAALREVGGVIDVAAKTVIAPSGEAAQRAWRIALRSSGVEFECLPRVEYELRLADYSAEYGGALFGVEVSA